MTRPPARPRLELSPSGARSQSCVEGGRGRRGGDGGHQLGREVPQLHVAMVRGRLADGDRLLLRSEEHTSELQSRFDLVCRLLLAKKITTHSNGASCSPFALRTPQAPSPFPYTTLFRSRLELSPSGARSQSCVEGGRGRRGGDGGHQLGREVPQLHVAMVRGRLEDGDRLLL